MAFITKDLCLYGRECAGPAVERQPGGKLYEDDKSGLSEGKDNMWINGILGADVWHLVAAFCIYSVLGWLVESIYMSICNHRLTNRGFAKRSVLSYLWVRSTCRLFFAASFCRESGAAVFDRSFFIATVFEYLVGRAMLRIFGEVWWDYREKPFNYQGIVCLESTIAWGFYAVIIIGYLHKAVMNMATWYTYGPGLWVLRIIIILFTIDFLHQFLSALHINVMEQRDRLMEKYEEPKARWY